MANKIREAEESAARDIIRVALKKTDGNMARAAALLGVHRQQLHYKIRRLGIEK